nr:hypothetical protein [Tanacetum cinerariifolium]
GVLPDEDDDGVVGFED